ncbi:Gp19/Gp15/Gp42 family protein [Microbacterium sp. BG28]|uniref:Gp19/Gp15/Gp42 family protein n=1 Tax=Microbacterium sp. BG28 TaxID=3097356 RepID=UPI002A59A138|nr:Gp19/Gp15/Gp42 family protein [Microbacterium sp. BG28]MDY0829131.1 Gp19/Gp15/Gp42 family protein [Microbacterium sp. BG28]
MTLPDVGADVLPKHYEGDLSSFSPDFVQGRLDEVVDKIESRYGPIVEARLASNKLKARLYEAIVCRLATRVYRNPEGYRSETEGSYQYNLSAAVASGTLWFTDEDITDLTGVSPKGTPTVGTVTVGQHRIGWV